MKHTFRYRVGSEPEPGAVVALPAADSHHLARVVRRRVGDPVELFDPAGRIWAGVVHAVGPPSEVRVLDSRRVGPSLVPVDLYLGAGDWGRFDRAVTEITEIGIASITVMATERGHVPGGQDAFDRRRMRVCGLIDAAGRQSGRAATVALRGLIPFSDVIAEVETSHAYLVDPRGEAGLSAVMRYADVDRAAILVGPAAGFSDAEVAAARTRGLAVCRLGDATLRAETAAVVATTLAADALGHLGSGA